MLPASSAVTWLMAFVVTVPLAVLLLRALPSGAPLLIAWHALLLVGGGAIVLALKRDDDLD
ncbi:MAG TPA: hypothetical protein VIV40_31665 [Kofleriaceae bacterium]